MIIRKPYAFLIKNFRLINFFILVLASYIFYKSSGILDFFNEYVDTREFIESNTLVNDIIPFNVIVFSILLIVGCLLITVLFKKKDKPVMFYVISILYYIAFIIICFVSRGMISTLVFEPLDPRISRVIRDIWLIVCMLQVVAIVFSLIRTLGFDVKKFNFGEDLYELQIDDEDNEEVEITTKFDVDKARMKAAMQREEYKAFFYENKLMIILVLLLLCVVIPTVFVARTIVVNKRYKVGEVIDLDDFNLKITGAYVTKNNNKGETLFYGDNNYLVVSFNIKNYKKKERGINLNNLRLEVNGKIYMPKTNYYDFFTDIGNGYNNNKISNTASDYIAVYVINDEDLNHEMIIRYADKLTVKNSMVNAVYYRTIIEPEKIDINRNLVNRALGDKLVIEYKELKGTSLNVYDYNIKDKFTYEVNGKTKYIVNSIGDVMSLKYDFFSNSISFDEFINNYLIIQYKYNDIMYSKKIKQLTISSDSKIGYFAVDENLVDATEISLVVNVRTTKYVYKIK